MTTAEWDFLRGPKTPRPQTAGEQDAAPTQAERENMPEHQFGDPENKKYPLDTRKHVLAAGSYAEKEHNAGRLSDAKYKEIVGRINAAKDKYGIGAGEKVSEKDAINFLEAGGQDHADSGREIAYRMDVGQIQQRRRNHQGGLVVDAKLTRTGVFTYKNPDGTVRRELRHPDEVFHGDTVESYTGAPLTVDHPGRVTPDNWKNVTVGHVAPGARQAGEFVEGQIHVQDAKTIQRAEDGDLKEVSCGYSCEIDPTPGEYQGEPFDVVQRRMRINHVALGPVGWGRMGRDVAMKLDSNEPTYLCDVEDASPMTPEEQKQLDKAKTDLATATAALEQSRQDGKSAKTAEAELAKIRAENEMLKLQVKRQDSEDQALANKAKFEAAVEEMIQLRADGQRVLGQEWKHDGKAGDDIRREVIKQLEPDYPKLDSLKGDTLQAVYNLAVAHEKRVGSSQHHMREVLHSVRNTTDAMPPGMKKGGGDDDEDDDVPCAEDARKAMVDKMKSGWKKDMGGRKGRTHDVGFGKAKVQ